MKSFLSVSVIVSHKELCCVHSSCRNLTELNITFFIRPSLRYSTVMTQSWETQTVRCTNFWQRTNKNLTLWRNTKPHKTKSREETPLQPTIGWIPAEHTEHVYRLFRKFRRVQSTHQDRKAQNVHCLMNSLKATDRALYVLLVTNQSLITTWSVSKLIWSKFWDRTDVFY